jgi:hypothetical protein
VTTPRLDDLIGRDIADGQRRPLQRAHDLLVAADPPPELPPELAQPAPPPRQRAIPVPRRYRSTAFIGAVIVALALFGIGYLVGGAGDTRQEVRTSELTGEGEGELVVFRADAAGNWPLELAVHDLRAPAVGTPYELWLTRDGALATLVGSFATDGGAATVTFNVPFALTGADTWAIVPGGSKTPVLQSAG